MSIKKKMWLVMIGVVLLNVCVIAGILFFTNKKIAESEISAAQSAALETDDQLLDEMASDNMEMVVESEMNDDFDELRTADPVASYNNIFSTLLIGDYIAEDGTAFRFAPDGVYEGYFNEDITDAENYSYEIVDNSLIIYSADKRSEVKYTLDINEDGDVVLVMPDSEMKYILCYDGMVYIGDKPNDTEDSDTTEETEKAVDETNDLENDENSDTEEKELDSEEQN